MRVPESCLTELREQGYLVLEGFLGADELAAAQEALWLHYPRPEEYFANPAAHAWLATDQWAGIVGGPWRSWSLNRLAFHPDLLELAERFLGSADLRLCVAELWAKYAGAVDYDQHHHRDYENHTIVVPRADQLMPQMTCFILLSDVTDLDGPTKAVPLAKTRDVPLGITQTKMGEYFADEVAVTGPAGSMLIYKTDVFHRGSNFKAPGRSRFVMPVDFKPRGWRWQGKLAWPDRTLNPGWKEAMVNMTPRQRDLFGWPPPGDPYWNAQTLSDVALRYPGIDLTPYGA